MNDLIWIGNTLYPRWVVFAAIATIPVTVLIIDLIIGIVKVIRGWGKP